MYNTHVQLITLKRKCTIHMYMYCWNLSRENVQYSCKADTYREKNQQYTCTVDTYKGEKGTIHMLSGNI